MTIRYTSVRVDDTVLQDRMKAIDMSIVGLATARIHVLLRREGVTINQNRLLRL